jgi:hypothetical protein
MAEEAGEYRVRILSPEVADDRYATRNELEAIQRGAPVYMQPGYPEDLAPGTAFLWIQTEPEAPGRATFWIEDGY